MRSPWPQAGDLIDGFDFRRRRDESAAQIALDTEDALTLADAYLKAYRIEKDSAGALDFADLIEKTCHLLRDRPEAAWVLYKLDGGLEHLLLDEAQDTAPDQWKIVEALVGEFFATREDERGLARTMFVVGDEKQSIYSFQGAAPELLLQKFGEHHGRATEAGRPFQRVDLNTSWRSTNEVLRFVDVTFAPSSLLVAIQNRDDPMEHRAAPPRASHAGCVDVWDLEVDRKADEREAWDAPLDLDQSFIMRWI